MVQCFSYFFQFKSKSGNKKFMISDSQLLVLFLLILQSFSIFSCKEFYQSGFGIDHLVMFMCRVVSCVCYDQCVLLAIFCQPFICFILYSKAKLACYCRYFLTFYFCISVPYDEKDVFFERQFQKILQVFIELFNFSFLALVVGAQTWITVMLNGLPWK